MSQIRVVLVDDHAVLRAGLRLLINAETDMLVIGEARDGEELWRVMNDVSPDVIVMDLSMPETNATTVMEELHHRFPGIRVLVLTMHDDAAYLRSSLGAGASGFLVKRAADTELISAIRAVHAGRTFVDVSMRGGSLAGPLRSPPLTGDAAHLTPRELEVMTLITAGHTYEEVARRLSLTVKTVETYRTRLARKLRVRTRAELVSYALRVGVLRPDSVPARALQTPSLQRQRVREVPYKGTSLA